jgi:hypothetical protein
VERIFEQMGAPTPLVVTRGLSKLCSPSRSLVVFFVSHVGLQTLSQEKETKIAMHQITMNSEVKSRTFDLTECKDWRSIIAQTLSHAHPYCLLEQGHQNALLRYLGETPASDDTLLAVLQLLKAGSSLVVPQENVRSSVVTTRLAQMHPPPPPPPPSPTAEYLHEEEPERKREAHYISSLQDPHHLVKLQPSYANLLYAFGRSLTSIMDTETTSALDVLIPDLTSDTERISVLLTGCPSHHPLNLRIKRHSSQKCVSLLSSIGSIVPGEQIPINCDPPRRLDLVHKILSAMEEMKEKAPLCLEYVLVPHYEVIIRVCTRGIKPLDSSETLLDRIKAFYPLYEEIALTKSEEADFRNRSWKTDVVKKLCTLSLSIIGQVLGIGGKSAEVEMKALPYVQYLDHHGKDAYCKMFSQWHRQKIESDHFGPFMFHTEVDTLDNSFFDMGVHDVYAIRNVTHLFLFSRKEWPNLLQKKANFYTNEPLDKHDIKRLVELSQLPMLRKPVGKSFFSNMTIAQRLENLDRFKILQGYEHILPRSIPNRTCAKKRPQAWDRERLGRRLVRSPPVRLSRSQFMSPAPTELPQWYD